MRTLSTVASLVACLTFAALTPAHADPGQAVDAPGAAGTTGASTTTGTATALEPVPTPASASAKPAPLGPYAPALERVATVPYRITSIATPSPSTLWLAGVDAAGRAVVQKVSKGRSAGARPRLHPATTLPAAAPRAVQVSAVDEAEAWLVTAPDPQAVALDGSEPRQTSTEVWRNAGSGWARVPMRNDQGTTATAWEVRDTPGRASALVNTGERIWRYDAAGLRNATTDIYRDDWMGQPTGFEYGLRPTADGFVAIGLTPMTVNYLRGRGGVVSLISTVGGWALGGQSLPSTWGLLPNGSTLILGESRQFDVDGDEVTQSCVVWSPADEGVACPAAPERATGFVALGDGSLLVAAGRLFHRAGPQGRDAAVAGDVGGGISALGAAPGARVAWVATRQRTGFGSTLSRYLVR